MKILMVSQTFYPARAGAECLCTSKLCLGLIRRGHKVRVVADRPRKVMAPIGSWEKLRTVAEYVGLDGNISVWQRALRSISVAMRHGIFTSAALNWIGPAVNKCNEEVRRSRPDVVWSRSRTVAALFVGYLVSRRHSIPWIASFSDPWPPEILPEPYHFPVSMGTAHRLRWLRKFLDSCAAATFPCARLRDWVLRAADRNQLKGKTWILHHIGGIDSVSFPGIKVRGKRPIVFVHLGSLGTARELGPARDPVPFLAALHSFADRNRITAQDMKVCFYGYKQRQLFQPVKALGLRRYVEIHGDVSYEHSLAIMHEADVLVLIEGAFREGIFLPSKLCDYIWARRPILALSPKVGTVADLLAEGGGLRVDTSDIGEITDGIEKSYLAAGSGDGNIIPSESLVHRFSEKTVLDRAEEMLARIIDNQQEGAA